MTITKVNKTIIENFLLLLPLTQAAPHSPRRQKLNLRMKSLSLDSPESTELHGRGRRYPPNSSAYHHGGSGGHLEHSTPPSNNSRLHCKSSNLFIIKALNFFLFISPIESIKPAKAFVCKPRT